MGSGMPVVLIGDPQGRFTRDQKVYGTGPAAPPQPYTFSLADARAAARSRRANVFIEIDTMRGKQMGFKGGVRKCGILE